MTICDRSMQHFSQTIHGRERIHTRRFTKKTWCQIDAWHINSKTKPRVLRKMLRFSWTDSLRYWIVNILCSISRMWRVNVSVRSIEINLILLKVFLSVAASNLFYSALNAPPYPPFRLATLYNSVFSVFQVENQSYFPPLILLVHFKVTL